MKKSKKDKAIDKEIERAYYAHGQGVQIDIMDIPRIFVAGHEAAASGMSIEAAVFAAINVYRKN